MSEDDFLEKAEQFGDILIKKDIINLATYEKAREVYIENHINRTLDENFRIRFISQILVEDFNADSDKVYHEIAMFYAFPELDIDVEDIPESHIKWVRDKFNMVDPSNQEKMIRYEVIPYMMWADYYDRHKAAMKFERLKNRCMFL